MPARPPRPRPVLAERSVFDGLDRRAVTYGDLVAHSVATICPSASALSTAFVLARVVGPGAWLSVVLGVGLAWLLATAFGEFGSRFTATGSLYTYAAKGLGATAGIVVGCALLLGYGSLVDYGLADASNQLGLAVVALGGAPPGAAALGAAVLLTAAACLLVLWCGIRWSSRFAFAAEALALSTLALTLAVLAARHGVPLDALGLAGASPQRVLAGTAMVMTVTIGFESCAALAVEAERPFRSVPRAMRTSVLLTGGLLLAGTVVGGAVPATGRGSARDGRWFGPGEAVSVLDALVLLVIALSYVALAVCAWTALSRLLLAFAREGLLPAWLGRTGRRSAIPGAAVLASTPVVVLPTLVSVARGEAPGAASYQVLVWASVVLMLAYGTTAAASVPFLGRLGELTARAVTVAVVGVLGVAALTWVEVRNDLARDEYDVLAVMAAVVAVGLLWRLLLWWRGLDPAAVGLHEAPLRSEVLLADRGPGRAPYGG